MRLEMLLGRPTSPRSCQHNSFGPNEYMVQAQLKHTSGGNDRPVTALLHPCDGVKGLGRGRWRARIVKTGGGVQ